MSTVKKRSVAYILQNTASKESSVMNEFKDFQVT